MAAKRPTPRDRIPILSHPITPAQLWKELSPAQQLCIRETLAAVCREWLVTPSAAEASRDE